MYSFMAGKQPQPLGHAGTSTSGPRPVSITDDNTYGGGSSSTLSAEAATGSHVLTVANYSATKKPHAAGGHLPSDTFTAGGFSWRITYSPNGFTDGTKDWICFGLHLEPPSGGAGAGALVQTRYSLLDRTGQPVPSSIRKERERAMSSMQSSLSYTVFMRRKRFESYYLEDNSFRVRCDVTVVTRTCRPSVPPPNLRRDLGELLATGVGADVTVEVGGEAFPVHRSILAARSPVFRAKLFGGPAGQNAAPMSSLKIHGIAPSMFRALLHFIYTDSLPEMTSDTTDEKVMMALGAALCGRGMNW